MPSNTRSIRTTASRTSPSSPRSISRVAATRPRPRGPSSRPATGISPGTCRSIPRCCRDLAEGGKGDLVIIPGTAVEFLTLNFSDPEQGGRRPAVAMADAEPGPQRQGGAPGARARRRPAGDLRELLLWPSGRAAGVQYPARHPRRHLAEYHLGVRPRQGERLARRGRLGDGRRRAAEGRRRP